MRLHQCSIHEGRGYEKDRMARQRLGYVQFSIVPIERRTLRVTCPPQSGNFQLTCSDRNPSSRSQCHTSSSNIILVHHECSKPHFQQRGLLGPLRESSLSPYRSYILCSRSRDAGASRPSSRSNIALLLRCQIQRAVSKIRSREGWSLC